MPSINSASRSEDSGACSGGLTTMVLPAASGAADFPATNMADLGDGILEGDVVECTLHFGAFHVPSGKAIREPCCTDLKTFRTEVKDGQVYVDLSAPATTGS